MFHRGRDGTLEPDIIMSIFISFFLIFGRNNPSDLDRTKTTVHVAMNGSTDEGTMRLWTGC
jgi:hypothetical protein